MIKNVLSNILSLTKHGHIIYLFIYFEWFVSISIAGQFYSLYFPEIYFNNLTRSFYFVRALNADELVY